MVDMVKSAESKDDFLADMMTLLVDMVKSAEYEDFKEDIYN